MPEGDPNFSKRISKGDWDRFVADFCGSLLLRSSERTTGVLFFS
jgi:hypothetical protein